MVVPCIYIFFPWNSLIFSISVCQRASWHSLSRPFELTYTTSHRQGQNKWNFPQRKLLAFVTLSKATVIEVLNMSTQESGKGSQISVLLWEGGSVCIQTAWGIVNVHRMDPGNCNWLPTTFPASAIMGCHCGRTAALQWDYWDSCWNWAEFEIGPTGILSRAMPVYSTSMYGDTHCDIRTQTNVNVHLRKHLTTSGFLKLTLLQKVEHTASLY